MVGGEWWMVSGGWRMVGWKRWVVGCEWWVVYLLPALLRGLFKGVPTIIDQHGQLQYTKNVGFFLLSFLVNAGTPTRDLDT